jgi:AhpD family alkylhydroperoxidase
MTTTAPAPTPTRSPVHPPRLAMAEQAPEVYRAMARLQAVAGAGLEQPLLELVKIRASQLNHCAFCLDMHTTDALAAGESTMRIVLLSAWHEARHLYAPRELAALALTEAVTVITDGFVPDEVWAQAAAEFDEAELAQLVAAITVINAWNRFAVTTRAVPAGASGS